MADRVIKAILINTYGDHPVLNLEQVELPAPSGNQVLMQREAIGVNYIDT